MSYDRVLPNPVSFRHETAPLPSLPRPSDLIDHKIMSAPPATSYMALPHRPSPGMAGNIHATSPQGVRYTSTMHQPNNISQTHQHLVSYDRRHSLAKIDRDGGQSPVQRTVKPSPTITTRDLGTTRSVSPSGSSSPAKSVKSDGLQFCLCQPEPKIPRPRNGECSHLCLLSPLLRGTSAAKIPFRVRENASAAQSRIFASRAVHCPTSIKVFDNVD